MASFNSLYSKTVADGSFNYYDPMEKLASPISEGQIAHHGKQAYIVQKKSKSPFRIGASLDKQEKFFFQGGKKFAFDLQKDLINGGHRRTKLQVKK